MECQWLLKKRSRRESPVGNLASGDSRRRCEPHGGWFVSWVDQQFVLESNCRVAQRDSSLRRHPRRIQTDWKLRDEIEQVRRPRFNESWIPLFHRVCFLHLVGHKCSFRRSTNLRLESTTLTHPRFLISNKSTGACPLTTYGWGGDVRRMIVYYEEIKRELYTIYHTCIRVSVWWKTKS
jgi:hypothetical protein